MAKICPICNQQIGYYAALQCEHKFCVGCIKIKLSDQDKRQVQRHCPICDDILPVDVVQRTPQGPRFYILAVINSKGRGANIRYKVLWADGSVSYEPKKMIENSRALERYQRLCRAVNQAKYHRKKKGITCSSQEVRDLYQNYKPKVVHTDSGSSDDE